MSFLTVLSPVVPRPSLHGSGTHLDRGPVGPDSSILAFANKWHKARRRRRARAPALSSNKSVRNLVDPDPVTARPIARPMAREREREHRSNSITLHRDFWSLSRLRTRKGNELISTSSSWNELTSSPTTYIERTWNYIYLFYLLYRYKNRFCR